MGKFFVAFASCCLVGTQLCAGPVTFNITSLSGSASGDFRDAAGTGFSASGDSITIGIYGGKQSDQFQNGWFPGAPIPGSFGMDCFSIYFQGCQEWAFATIGGKSVELILSGSTLVSASTSLTFEPPNYSYTIPGATAIGEYAAVCDPSIFQPNCVAGTLVANVVIDLPGTVSDAFGPPNPNDPGGGYVFDGQGFTSTSTPEPASFGLLLVGVGTVAAMFARRRRGSCGSTLS